MINNNHNRTFSIMKAVGIIFVIISHTALYTYLYYFSYFMNIVVFFFVAGYFFNDNYLKNPILYFSKKIKRLYIPWVLYGIAFVLLHNLFLKINFIAYNFNTKIVFEPYQLSDIVDKSLQVLTFYRWKEPLLAPLWFLTGLFSGLSVFYAISFVSQKISKVRFEQFRFILVLFFLIAGFLGPEINARFTLFYRAFVISALIYAGKIYQ